MEYEQIDKLCSIHGDKIDGFYFFHIFDYRGALLQKEAIVIYENKISMYVDYINKHKIDKVIIYILPNGIHSLNFLLDIPHVRFLRILGNVDYTPLYKLTNLKLLIITGKNEIELDKLIGLESFHTSAPDYMRINNEIQSLKSLHLSSDGITNICFNDLSFLSKTPNLDTLIFQFTDIESLKGIEVLKQLKVLILKYNKKLTNISTLNGVSDTLRHLRIENSNKIENFETIGSLKELIFLIISNIKMINSLNFIYELKNLKSFLFESNVIDGDITPTINLKHTVVFPIRKHYYKIVNGEKMKVTYNDFPYGERETGDEEIELWRRIDT
ncbi:MAG: hypothetical protein K0Q49_743 [Haloplasmataceae bacterium]|jgi:hypothetical protein|nr:hypothetical protein [Haloplasmataceae bacterium]